MQAHGEVRGTQSFVGVMSSVWKRPSLTGLEILWHWAAGIPTLALCAWEYLRISPEVKINAAALQAMTLFKPVQATETIATTLHALAPAVLPVLAWLVPLAVLLRTVAAAIGRAAVQRRLDATLRPKRAVLAGLSLLRMAALAVVLAAWLWMVHWANAYAISGPARHGGEPDVVLLCAIAIFGTLALFVLWAGSIWVLDAAFALAGDRRTGLIESLRGALRLGTARSKFIEINLVSGIVKLELIVLVLVFSSCPLPFESVESQTFLAWWWAGVIAMYLLGSDFFHVVRMASYLALERIDESGNAPGEKSAS